MQSLAIAVLAMSAAIALSTSPLDCHFDDKRSFCRWKREWFGLQRAGWRSGNEIMNGVVTDQTSGEGKIAFSLARSRPTGFRSRLRSPAVVPHAGSCFVFSVAMGGARWAFPDGNSILRLFLVGEGESIEHSISFWENGERTGGNGQFVKVVLPVDDAVQHLNSVSVQFVFETIRGGSKKAYVAIDDVSLQPCERTTEGFVEDEEMHVEERKKMTDVKNKLLRLMLPARTGQIGVIEFEDSFAGISVVPSNGSITTSAIHINPETVFDIEQPTPTQRRPIPRKRKGRRQRRRRKSKRGKKRKGRRRRRKNRKSSNNDNNHGFGNVYLETETETLSASAPTSQAVMCDFIEYTLRLQRCLRNFFSMLRKRPRSCTSRYLTLETCTRQAATSCVPTSIMEPIRVEEIVVGTLRNNFQTKKVFCEEEGAFVYPEFAVAKLPIQCGNRYFIKLSECSGSFSHMFHLQHGDPQLCKEYYAANECQRQTTAEECNFDTETMLLYGLNLQYQFAHNPFCLHLPFSSWWPES